MQQRIDVPLLYADAQEQFEPVQYDGTVPLPWPAECPFTLDQLLRDKRGRAGATPSHRSPKATA
jgi:hypothetical protein